VEVLVVQTLGHTKVNLVALEAEVVMTAQQLLAEHLQQINQVIKEQDLLEDQETTPAVVAVAEQVPLAEKEGKLDLVEHSYL
jgi:hypothetical protein